MLGVKHPCEWLTSHENPPNLFANYLCGCSTSLPSSVLFWDIEQFSRGWPADLIVGDFSKKLGHSPS
jgi:hypothetical protein